MDKKVFYITQTLFIETEGDARNGKVETVFHVKGKKLSGYIYFSQDPPAEGQKEPVGVIVSLSVQSTEICLDVITLSGLLGDIIQNESGIATVLGNAYLTKFFEVKF